LIISCGDGAVDLEVAERPLDAVALTIKPLVVADRLGAVRSWRDDGANASLLEVAADASESLALSATRAPGARSGNSISVS